MISTEETPLAKPIYWLSYGGGVNSTALAILACNDQLAEVPAHKLKIIFSDTGNERPETYRYLAVFANYLARFQQRIIMVSPKETVLDRWMRYQMTGSRQNRACTDHAKRRPIKQYIKSETSTNVVMLLGISAEESHRARAPAQKEWQTMYPLVDQGITREGCIEIIKAAGLEVPVKSGCWHCPFMKVREITGLATHQPDLFAQIATLETVSNNRRAIFGSPPCTIGETIQQATGRPGHYKKADNWHYIYGMTLIQQYHASASMGREVINDQNCLD